MIAVGLTMMMTVMTQEYGNSDPLLVSDTISFAQYSAEPNMMRAIAELNSRRASQCGKVALASSFKTDPDALLLASLLEQDNVPGYERALELASSSCDFTGDSSQVLLDEYSAMGAYSQEPQILQGLADINSVLGKLCGQVVEVNAFGLSGDLTPIMFMFHEKRFEEYKQAIADLDCSLFKTQVKG